MCGSGDLWQVYSAKRTSGESQSRSAAANATVEQDPVLALDALATVNPSRLIAAERCTPVVSPNVRQNGTEKARVV
jgi:hypothetical protein